LFHSNKKEEGRRKKEEGKTGFISIPVTPE